MAKFNFKAIGTSWQIEIFDDINKNTEENLLKKILNRIDEFDKTYSRFRADSLITKISKQVGQFNFPSDSKLLFDTYFDIYKKTNGLVTPLIGSVLVDAGYDAQYSLKQKKQLVEPPKWEQVIEFNSINDKDDNLSKEISVKSNYKLLVKKPVMLDFGAGGKGYLVDIIGELLIENKISRFYINAGGDILYKNLLNQTLRVGLEDPDDFTKVIGVYNLKNGSIAGSAGNRRKWADFTHIINPKTGKSPKNISAVWIVADNTFTADILTTCLFFISVDSTEFISIRSTYKFEYFIVYSDRSIKKSDNFEAEIYTS